MYEPLKYEIDITTMHPDTVKDFEEFIEIGKVENHNFNTARLNLLEAFSMRFVHEASEKGIARWERMLKLKRRSDDDLELRRKRVLAKINNKLPYTWRTLIQLMNSLFGSGAYEIELDCQSFELYMAIPAESNYYYELIKVLDPMLPLNIYFLIDLLLDLSNQIYIGSTLEVGHTLTIYPNTTEHLTITSPIYSDSATHSITTLTIGGPHEEI